MWVEDFVFVLGQEETFQPNIQFGPANRISERGARLFRSADLGCDIPLAALAYLAYRGSSYILTLRRNPGGMAWLNTMD
jgi:hypothetical protein